jgi:CRP-like cAMP-binding protein
LVSQYLLFSGVSREDREEILTLAREVKIARGQTIFCEGDLVEQVVLLIAGSMKLFQLGAQGMEVILRLVGPGHALCLKCFPKQTHCATAVAVENSAALVWEACRFEAVKQRYPTMERNIASVLLHTLNELEERFREVGTEKVAARLSGQLLRLIEQVGKPADGCVEIVLTQKDLAQLIGASLFTVSRLLSE